MIMSLGWALIRGLALSRLTLLNRCITVHPRLLSLLISHVNVKPKKAGQNKVNMTKNREELTLIRNNDTDNIYVIDRYFDCF